jgi:hypothetical protein
VLQGLRLQQLQRQQLAVPLLLLLLQVLIHVLATLLPAMLQQQHHATAVARLGPLLQPSPELLQRCVAAVLVLPKDLLLLLVVVVLQLLLTALVQLPTTAAELAVSRALAPQQLRYPAAAAAAAAGAALAVH